MKRKLKVLVVDDSPVDTLLITHMLETEFQSPEITRAQCRTSFTAALLNSTYDIILCDHFTSNITSLDALEQVKISHPEIPLIIVTSHNNNELARNAIDEGAYDYVLKADLFRLPTAIKNAIDYSAVKKELEEIKKIHVKSN